MNISRYRWFFGTVSSIAPALLVSGCFLGYPVRARVSCTEVASRVGWSGDCSEAIEKRSTDHRCTMLVTPDGVLQDWIWSVSKSYFLCRSGSKMALPFLSNRDWEKIVPVPSTNLWVAIETPKRNGKRDDFYVVLFQSDHVIHKRLLKSVALREDGYYAGFLHFSPSRWVVWYPAQDGQVQYDLLRDAFIDPLQKWEEDEGEQIRGRGRPPRGTR